MTVREMTQPWSPSHVGLIMQVLDEAYSFWGVGSILYMALSPLTMAALLGQRVWQEPPWPSLARFVVEWVYLDLPPHASSSLSKSPRPPSAAYQTHQPPTSDGWNKRPLFNFSLEFQHVNVSSRNISQCNRDWRRTRVFRQRFDRGKKFVNILLPPTKAEHYFLSDWGKVKGVQAVFPTPPNIIACTASSV